jgi:hypothetical protein
MHGKFAAKTGWSHPSITKHHPDKYQPILEASKRGFKFAVLLRSPTDYSPCSTP